MELYVQEGQFPSELVRKEGIKLGAYLGVISFVISTLTMYILMNSDDFKMTSIITGTLSIILMIGLSAFFSLMLRKTAGGFWNFSEALKSIFTMLAIAIIITHIGSALFNVIVPEPQQVVFDKTINMTIETMESMGVEDDVIDKQVADLEKTRDDLRVFSIGQTLKGLGVNLILYFVFSLILAAIFKRERPAFLRVPANEANTDPDQENN